MLITEKNTIGAERIIARAARMQQTREARADDWRPVIPLRETEGY